MTVYNGRYELSTQVARGGTAQVYLARDLLLDRPVALKVLFPELSTDHTFVERFRREAQAAANLSHPNIVPVFDWGQSDSTYFIVMEYVDGEALSSIIKTQAPLEPHQAASIAADIAKALSYAHRHGVVHRDVKPGNVLITSDGQVKVTDFGIARAIGRDEQVTQTGLVMGTATYFSPEQAQGLDVDGRSDIYSLGVVLYEMLCGKPPFAGDSPVSIAYQHVRETPPTPRAINPSIPASLEAVVLQAMAKLPAERYGSAEDLRADLDRYLRGQTVLARPPSEYAAGPQTEAVASTRRPRETTRSSAPVLDDGARRRTTPYWIGAAVVLVLAIVATVIFGGRSLGYFGGAKYFKIPKVLGMSQSAASTILTDKGLKVHTTPVIAHNATQAHTVVLQVPAFPTDVRRGDPVTLDVAGAAPTKSVPPVVGETAALAESQLKNAGFMWKLKNVQSATLAIGLVAGQKPAGNTDQAPGSTIVLSVVVSKQQVAIPTDIVGSATMPVSQAQAGAILGAARLSVATVQTQVVSSLPPGSVVTTSPAPGTKVAVGTPIVLVISGGPGVNLPDVRNELLMTAESNLTAAGFTGPYTTTNVPTSNASLVGCVQKTKPKAGSGPYLAGPKPIELWVYTENAGTPGGGTGVAGSSGACSGAPNPTTTTTTTATTTTTTTTLPVAPG